MSFSKRFYEIVHEMEKLDEVRDKLRVEMFAEMGAQVNSPAGPAPKAAKAKADPKAKPLKAVILSVMGQRRMKLDTLVERVSSKLGTSARPASVGASLSSLVRTGKVVGDPENGYSLPKAVEAQQPSLPDMDSAAPPTSATVETGSIDELVSMEAGN